MGIMTELKKAAARLEGRFRQCVAVVVGVGSIGFGLSLALLPGALATARGFRVAVEWASPGAWGLFFAAFGIMLVATSLSAMRTAVWPAAGLSVIYGLMVIAVAAGSSFDVPPPPAIWLYLTMTVISSLLAQSTLVSPPKR